MGNTPDDRFFDELRRLDERLIDGVLGESTSGERPSTARLARAHRLLRRLDRAGRTEGDDPARGDAGSRTPSANDYVAAARSANRSVSEPAPTDSPPLSLAKIYARASVLAADDSSIEDERRAKLVASYRRIAVQLLVKAQAQGFFSDRLVASFVEMDELAPLREHPDFKTLVGDAGNRP